MGQGGEMKYVSDCCGKKARVIKVKFGKNTTWETPITWGYICSKCNKPCTPIQQKSGSEEGKDG